MTANQIGADLAVPQIAVISAAAAHSPYPAAVWCGYMSVLHGAMLAAFGREDTLLMLALMTRACIEESALLQTSAKPH